MKGGLTVDINSENYIYELKHHNSMALEYIINSYGGVYKSVISKVLFLYPEDAEECLYDSFMRIWKNIGQYDETKTSFLNWSAAVARYCALDRLRKLRDLTLNTEYSDEIETRYSGFTSDKDFDRYFEELISCLKAEDRELFIRLFFYGHTIGEVARDTGKMPSYIYNRVSRAKKKIRKNHPELLKGEMIQ